MKREIREIREREVRRESGAIREREVRRESEAIRVIPAKKVNRVKLVQLDVMRTL